MDEQPRESVRMETVEADSAGQRLDNYLMRQLKGVPRSLIYRIVRRGEVRVNGRRARVSQRLAAGDVVRIPPVRRQAPAGPARFDAAALARFEQRILYEDAALLVWNKPAGMAVHGGSGLSWGVIELARAARPQARRLELVHRLDRETSGVILMAKKTTVLRALHAQMREHRMEKCYQALAAGRWPDGRRRVDLPLKKNVLRSGERVVTVSPEGKPSVSWFEPLAVCSVASRLKVRLKTGRTHQIRVHARACGHPLLGDEKYGTPEANRRARACGLRRLALHAWQLGFTHPVTEAPMLITAPPPEQFDSVWRCLCQKA